MRTARFIVPFAVAACLLAVGCKKKPKASKGDKAATGMGMPADAMDMAADDTGDMAAKPADGFPVLKCNDTKESRKKSIKRDKKGRVLHCYLKVAQVLNGVKCKPGGYYTTLHPSGRLKECTIDKGASVKLGGIKCAGGGIKLYPDGKLAQCRFATDVVEVNGVKCHYRAEFHKNGRLRRCTNVKEYTKGKQTIGAESWVYFKPDGFLYRADMAKNPYPWKGKKCAYAHFYPNGKVKTCEIKKKIKINGKLTPLNVTLCYTPKGKKTNKVEGGFTCGNLKKAIKLLKKLKKRKK